MLTLEQQLQNDLSTLGLELSVTQQEQLMAYLALLQKWNAVYNLTAIKEPERMLTHHLLDSLAVSVHCVGERWLDVGSGAGLPGIPLAIANPDKHVTCLDSNGKRTRFMTQVVCELNLQNVQVVQSRAEDHQTDIPYSCILSRAFTALPNMLAKTEHLCCNGGVFLALKGNFPEAEIAASQARFPQMEVIRIQVPRLDAERHVIKIRKEVSCG